MKEEELFNLLLEHVKKMTAPGRHAFQLREMGVAMDVTLEVRRVPHAETLRQWGFDLAALLQGQPWRATSCSQYVDRPRDMRWSRSSGCKQSPTHALVSAGDRGMPTFHIVCAHHAREMTLGLSALGMLKVPPDLLKKAQARARGEVG